jgi:pimeloyl-ACP methyl ester carboxylesterase
MSELITSSGLWASSAGPPGRPLIVLIHGSMDRSSGLVKLSRRLVTDFTVVRYDRRGYGRSASTGSDSSMGDQVDDLVEVIDCHRALHDRSTHDRSKTSAATLFGHSFGGNIALAAAAGHPDLTNSVITYETPLSWLPWWPTSTAGAVAIDRGDPGDAAEAFMRRMIGDERWERLPPSSRAARRSEGAAMVAELTDLRDHPPWAPDEVRLPVLALAGERGRDHHRRSTAYLAEHLVNCRSSIVADASHAGPNTHPDAVAASIRSFLALIAG